MLSVETGICDSVCGNGDFNFDIKPIGFRRDLNQRNMQL
jgi:hypothetical protein